MSDQSKHYDYFKVEGEDVKAMIAKYDEIADKRQSVINDLCNKFEAIGYTDSTGFGDKGSFVRNLIWPADFKFAQPMTIKLRSYIDGKPAILARGKGNSKEGRAFNKSLDAAIADCNKQLATLPSWQAYIIEHYDVMKTGIGGSSGLGLAMLTTYGGKYPGRDDCLLFAIPNNKNEKRHGKITVPENFQKLTYGQFYDITNVESEEAA
ncbi:hypothetical protein SOASR030_01620 [Leminorella grimontii]|uniref:Eac protein n=1 Tax=Leminorella grimontii TaxID=82981 RepID=A0AAV5MXL1_9GAMM|nr:DUF5420 family protein [Leminorella grimontii]KFC95382.1 EaC family phage protein [Leminorella grimontii ATCC 33999 = DSM 5078]GKX54050.1 hypothetical protein SOASR030_01620 [Leminorella grimontii]VFS60194.1 Uncharacterised protein [Leminorella grimontii]